MRADPTPEEGDAFGHAGSGDRYSADRPDISDCTRRIFEEVFPESRRRF